MKIKHNQCIGCGKETTNKEFCSGECRKIFNMNFKENNFRFGKRSYRGLRA
jgi:predicted nucleic acid-binding Zn ribbon protein